MEKDNLELNKKQMSDVNGGAEAHAATIWTANSAYCTLCGSAMSAVKSEYVCLNGKCKDFGVKKSRNEVNWL